MNFLKPGAIALTIALVALLFVGLLLPGSTEVSRSIVIERNVDSVFKMVNSYRAFNQWSPWASLDPTARYIYSGPESGVGAAMSWHSDNPQVGAGNQEIIESIANEKISVKLQFDNQPGATAYFLFKPLSNQQAPAATMITWGFSTEHGLNPINRYIGLMLDSWVGKDYKTGLENLKSLLERH